MNSDTQRLGREASLGNRKKTYLLTKPSINDKQDQETKESKEDQKGGKSDNSSHKENMLLSSNNNVGGSSSIPMATDTKKIQGNSLRVDDVSKGGGGSSTEFSSKDEKKKEVPVNHTDEKKRLEDEIKDLEKEVFSGKDSHFEDILNKINERLEKIENMKYVKKLKRKRDEPESEEEEEEEESEEEEEESEEEERIPVVVDPKVFVKSVKTINKQPQKDSFQLPTYSGKGFLSTY